MKIGIHVVRAITAATCGLFLVFPANAGQREDGMLSIGTPAPDFTLRTQTGDTVHLASFRGENAVVLVFYPGDETPGCTKQLCAIRNDYSKFLQKDAAVFGINPAGKKSHVAFVKKFAFQFPLLIDKGESVASLYGCKGLFMITRTVYVVDKNGNISFAQRGMPEVAEILKSLGE